MDRSDERKSLTYATRNGRSKGTDMRTIVAGTSRSIRPHATALRIGGTSKPAAPKGYVHYVGSAYNLDPGRVDAFERMEERSRPRCGNCVYVRMSACATRSI